SLSSSFALRYPRGPAAAGSLDPLAPFRTPKSEILRSVPDHANRRVVDESPRSCLTPRLIDLAAIDYAHGRYCCRADSTNLDPLWNERAGNENQPLRDLLLMFRAFYGGSTGERCGGEDAGGKENCRADRY